MEKILSLYDGMSCGYLAMQSAGVDVSKYDAFEIDKYAVQTSKHNFPDIEHHGDVTGADFSQFRGYDYLIGGSPCTYWSIAQSPDKRETTASGLGWELFSHYVRALKEAQPRYFIYENNYSMAKAIRESITDAFGFEPIMINSALVSAQNRKRLYWVGIRNERGEYERADVQQPDDRQIFLKDILESAEPINATADGKSQTLKAQYQQNNAQNFCCYKSTYGATGVAEPAAGREVGCKINENGKRADNRKDIDTVQRYEINENPQKTNTLTTVQKDNLVAEPFRYCNDKNVEHLMRPYGSKAAITCNETEKAPTILAAMGTGGGNGIYTAETAGETPAPNVYEVKDGQITVKGKKYPIKLKDGFYIIRKLTVTECKRLQTVPDWYEFPVSNSQAYKMLGNGWTVEVIAHLIKATQDGKTAGAQLSLL